MLRAVESAKSSAVVAVGEACARARRAQQAFASTSLRSRVELLAQLRRALLRRAEEIIAVVVDESAKVRFEAITLEIVPSALSLAYNAHIARDALRPRRVRPYLPLPRRATRSFTPRGVCGLITPFNYTVSIPMSSIAPAIAAGNAVVWKPAESGTRAAHALVRLFEDAGMPRDLIVVVDGTSGGSIEEGRALVDGPIDHLTFVGSTTAGKQVGARCGERLLPCILELGGNAPAIVADDADLDRASRAIVFGSLCNAGQSCIAVERVFAVSSVFDELLQRTSALADRVRVGVDVGAVNPTQLAKVEAWRRDVVERGAVVHGSRGAVLDVTAARLPVAPLSGEVFGPVIPMHRVASVDEAVTRANLAPQQLCAYVFAGEAKSARAVAAKLSAPHVVINDAMISYAMMELPFGGEGASGFGRVHGKDGLRALSKEQIVVDAPVLGALPIAKEPWWLPYDARVGEVILRGLETALSLRDRWPF